MPDQTPKKPRREWPEGQAMAYDLMKRHPELLANCPPPSDILFVIDNVNEPTSKGTPVMAKVSKITGKLTDFIDAGEKTFMLEWFTQNNGYLTLNQCYILMLQQLLLFETDGNGGHRIGGWDIQESEVIADRLGFKWASDKRGEAPDIMASDFQWGRVGQSRIDFAKAMAEAKQKEREAKGEPKLKVEQSRIDLEPPIARKSPDELKALAAELVAGFGLDGAKAIVSLIKEAKRLPPETVATLKQQGITEETLASPLVQDAIREYATSTDARPTDGWQPEQPYVAKDNVVPFPKAAGTGQ